MSTLFLRTLREDPADAEVPSHRLLVRAGYVRRVAPGIYSWLPLGLKVLNNIAAVVREELAASPHVAAVELRVTRIQDHLADGRTAVFAYSALDRLLDLYPGGSAWALLTLADLQRAHDDVTFDLLLVDQRPVVQDRPGSLA